MKKDTVFQIRLTVSQKEALFDKALKAGLSACNYIIKSLYFNTGTKCN